MANSDGLADFIAVAEPVPIHTPSKFRKLQEEMVLDCVVFFFVADSDSVRGRHQT